MPATSLTHADSLASTACLSLALPLPPAPTNSCGNYTEAESLYRCALDARAAALGPDHPDVALTAHNLGICLSSVGRHADALQLHRQALAVRQRLHGRGSSGGGGNGSGGKPRMHPELLASHRNVGLCLSRQVGKASREVALRYCMPVLSAMV